VVEKSSKHLPLPSEHDHPASKGASASYYDSSDDSSDYPPPLGPFYATMGESPGDLDSFMDSRMDGEDWFALYNPHEPRSLNVSLVFQIKHNGPVLYARFSKDGLWLATGGGDGAHIFDVRTGTLRCILLCENGNNTGDITSVCFSPDGKYLATGVSNGLIQVNFFLSSTHRSLSLTGGLVCWGTDILSILPPQIWDITRKCIGYTFKGHRRSVNSLDFSHDGSFIVSGSDDGKVRIWNMNTRESRVFPIAGHFGPIDRVTCVAVSPNDRFVGAGSSYEGVNIWDLETRTLIDHLGGRHDWPSSFGRIHSVAFTPDGEGLVSCSEKNTLRYWGISTALNGTHKTDRQFLKSVQNFTGHRKTVMSVAISHDGRWIVSGSEDCGVQFWDIHGRTHLMLQGHHAMGTPLPCQSSDGLMLL